MMADKFKFDYFEMSELLDGAINEANTKLQKYFRLDDAEATKQIELKARGLNCENGFVWGVVLGKILGYRSGTIICGFPREYEQAKTLIEFAKNTHLGNRIAVILPKISEKISLQRMMEKQKGIKGEYFVPEEIEVLFQGIKTDFSQVVSVLAKNKVKLVYANGNLSPEESFQLLMQNIKKP